jgi:hypothetical protein
MISEKTIEWVYQEGFEAGLAQARREQNASGWRREVEKKIDDMSWVHEDPTGQDADLLDPLYEELIEARDHEFKVRDPEAWAERRMGA